MKITKTEMVIFAFMLFVFLAFGMSVRLCHKVIESNGGIRQIIIDAGKDIRSIKEEIEKK